MNVDYLALSLDAIDNSQLPQRCKDNLLDCIYKLPNMCHRQALDLTDYENVKARIRELEGVAGV